GPTGFVCSRGPEGARSGLGRVFRQRRGRRSRCERSMAKEAVPAALVAPARTKSWKQEIPAARLHANSGSVAVRAPVAFGKQVEEEDRREDTAADEESADDENAQHGIEHRALLQSLLHIRPRFYVGDITIDPLDHHFRAGGELRGVEAPCTNDPPLRTDLEADFSFNVSAKGFRHTSQVALQHVSLIVDIMLRRDRPPLPHEACRDDRRDHSEHSSGRRGSAGRYRPKPAEGITDQAEYERKGDDDRRRQAERSLTRWALFARPLDAVDHDAHAE